MCSSFIVINNMLLVTSDKPQYLYSVLLLYISYRIINISEVCHRGERFEKTSRFVDIKYNLYDKICTRMVFAVSPCERLRITGYC